MLHEIKVFYRPEQKRICMLRAHHYCVFPVVSRKYVNGKINSELSNRVCQHLSMEVSTNSSIGNTLRPNDVVIDEDEGQGCNTHEHARGPSLSFTYFTVLSSVSPKKNARNSFVDRFLSSSFLFSYSSSLFCFLLVRYIETHVVDRSFVAWYTLSWAIDDNAEQYSITADRVKSWHIAIQLRNVCV